jgi:hypothetical protein
MTKRSSSNDQKLAIGIDAVLSGTTPGTAVAIDTLGSANIVIHVFTGTITDAGTAAGITWALTECDTSGGSYTAVAAAEIDGSLADLSILLDTDDNKYIGSIGYLGTKRFLKITPTGTAGTDGAVKAVAIMTELAFSKNA